VVLSLHVATEALFVNLFVLFRVLNLCAVGFVKHFLSGFECADVAEGLSRSYVFVHALPPVGIGFFRSMRRNGEGYAVRAKFVFEVVKRCVFLRSLTSFPLSHFANKYPNKPKSGSNNYHENIKQK